MKGNKMAQEQDAKGAFIEKLLFALLPLLMAGVGYLLNAVSTLSHQVTVLESKVSLVVTSDNKQASNTGAELAREKLRQDLTAETVIDGWLHTGDIGEIVDGKFLKITDRKKELFKTSGGKYVAPQPIENKMKESPFIEQIVLIGDNRKFVSALIVPGFSKLKDWCKQHGIEYVSNEAIVTNSMVQALFNDEVAKYNCLFNQVEQVKKFTLLPREFTIDRQEMTPKLSIRRKNVLTNFEKEIEAMYVG